MSSDQVTKDFQEEILYEEDRLSSAGLNPVYIDFKSFDKRTRWLVTWMGKTYLVYFSKVQCACCIRGGAISLLEKSDICRKEFIGSLVRAAQGRTIHISGYISTLHLGEISDQITIVIGDGFEIDALEVFLGLISERDK